MGPRAVQSSCSSSFRWLWSRVTAELVIAGLATEAPRAGPPVVFTIWTHTGNTVRLGLYRLHSYNTVERAT